MKTKRILACSVVLLTVLSVHAEQFGFHMAEPPAPDTYLESIAGQMFMDTDTGSSQVGLSNIEFSNAGDSASTITEIYFGSFDANLNLDVTAINDFSVGVDFTIERLNPSDPPGSADATWWYITLDGAEGTPPPAHNGIDPYEYVNLQVSYANSSYSFTQLIQNDIVQVALHVTGLTSPEGSATFVNDTEIVPEPASLLLIGSAGALIGFVRRRFIA